MIDSVHKRVQIDVMKLIPLWYNSSQVTEFSKINLHKNLPPSILFSAATILATRESFQI